VPAGQRMRITKVLQNWTAGLHRPGTWHGAGPTQAQMISLHRAANIEKKTALPKKLPGSGIEGNP
jgi:4-hydroxybutyryl-CoA dehydratase / vinylacetyl-CoA-Delta-isomerase